MGALDELDDALAGLPADERTDAAAPALAGLALQLVDLDEDDLAAAVRRGLLLAAVGGSPAESVGPGSPAARETAADLADVGAAAPFAAALRELAERAGDQPHVRAGALELAGDEPRALDGLAVLLLAAALAGDDD